MSNCGNIPCPLKALTGLMPASLKYLRLKSCLFCTYIQINFKLGPFGMHVCKCALADIMTRPDCSTIPGNLTLLLAALPCMFKYCLLCLSHGLLIAIPLQSLIHRPFSISCKTAIFINGNREAVYHGATKKRILP